jgi:hypothetical protein
MTVFVLGDRKMVPSSSWATPSKATSKGTMKGTKGDKRGKTSAPGGSQSLPAATTATRKRTVPMRSMSHRLSTISRASVAAERPF